MAISIKRLKRITENIFFPFSENPNNKQLEKEYIDPDLPIYAFYHIYAANNWKSILTEQITDLKRSGLYHRINKIYVSIICNSEDDYNFAVNKLGEKAEFIHKTNNSKVYEFPALEYLKNKADREEFYCLYFHTKGSGNSNQTLQWYKPAVKTLKDLIEISSGWRQFMAYWNFYKYKLAISVIQNPQWGGVYGANYQMVENGKHFYAGNFWWATSSYIQTCESFDVIDKTWRFNAETWLLERKQKDIYDAYRMTVNLVAVKFPIKILTGNRLDKIISKNIFYYRHINFSMKKIMRRLSESK